MRVLILGGAGMLGHALWRECARRFETYVTMRQVFERYAGYGLFERARTLAGVAIEDADGLARAIATARPRVVVNCIGIVKQHPAAADPLESISVNALFPHRLARLCHGEGIRLVHISTDCVFSGRRGHYREDDVSDAEDLYGRTKFLGEVGTAGCLTLRTSMIGRELTSARGLVEWFRRQDGGVVRGYRRAVFSGLTTDALSRVVAMVIAEWPRLDGVWHVAADPISKYDVLSLARDALGLRVQIEPDDTVVCDRSLDGERFRRVTGWVAPPWPEMIQDLDETRHFERGRAHAH